MNENKSIRLEVADGFYLSRIVRADKAAYLEHFADPTTPAVAYLLVRPSKAGVRHRE